MFMTLRAIGAEVLAMRTIWSQVGAGELVRSTDGGATWSVVHPPMASDLRPKPLPTQPG